MYSTKDGKYYTSNQSPERGVFIMSRSSHGSEDNCQIANNVYTPSPISGLGNCCCSFPTLVILILIILQFSKRREGTGRRSIVDNSILFIIALFYLSCCNPCKR